MLAKVRLLIGRLVYFLLSFNGIIQIEMTEDKSHVKFLKHQNEKLKEEVEHLNERLARSVTE